MVDFISGANKVVVKVALQCFGFHFTANHVYVVTFDEHQQDIIEKAILSNVPIERIKKIRNNIAFIKVRKKMNELKKYSCIPYIAINMEVID